MNFLLPIIFLGGLLSTYFYGGRLLSASETGGFPRRRGHPWGRNLLKSAPSCLSRIKAKSAAGKGVHSGWEGGRKSVAIRRPHFQQLWHLCTFQSSIDLKANHCTFPFSFSRWQRRRGRRGGLGRSSSRSRGSGSGGRQGLHEGLRSAQGPRHWR